MSGFWIGVGIAVAGLFISMAIESAGRAIAKSINIADSIDRLAVESEGWRRQLRQKGRSG